MTTLQRIYHYVYSAAILAALVIMQPLAGGAHNLLFASTLCVNPGGTGGCYASINAAVAAASANDTISVHAGTYAEDVIVNKPLSIVGENRANTIVDASGQANGFNVDGLNNPGLANATITGFTIQNANFEGIVITSASYVTVWGNHVVGNDKALSNESCPGLPSWETNENEDCGEAVHLSGVDHSVITSNNVEQNAAGILLSDELAVTHDNLVSYNSVHDNPDECGITLASHPPAPTRAPARTLPGGQSGPWGLSHNTIFANVSYHNGYLVGGAGIGVFDSIPGTSNVGNVIVGNVVHDNGHPGVAMHSHAPGQNLTDTIIAGNVSYNNGADDGDAATPGPTGINLYAVSPATGTILSQNTIRNEQVGIGVNTGTQVLANLNNIMVNGLNIGLDNLGSGSVNATENWWGCPGGPGSNGCATISGDNVLYTPWLMTLYTHLGVSVIPAR
jgi:parallel beta helix pectate lyase-like protein